MLMILPRPRGFITRIASRAQRKAAVRLSPITSFQ